MQENRSFISCVDLPVFSTINPAEIEQVLIQLITKNRAQLTELIASASQPGWEFMCKLEELEDCLARFWSPIGHLHAVRQTTELHQAYQRCLAQLTAYQAEVDQNRALYQRIEQLINSPVVGQFDYAQQKAVQNRMRDFRLRGVGLETADQHSYRAIKTRLAYLSTQFEKHVLDATTHWIKMIANRTELAGLPDYAIVACAQAAQQRGLLGWLLTLDQPCYLPVLNYADNPALRMELYQAYVIRASDQGPASFDNSQIMFEILQERYALSRLLGFANYAEFSLASDKMAKSPEEVLGFLQKLLHYARPKALVEQQALQQFATEQGYTGELQAWDIPYYSEKLREQLFGLSEVKLRSYFPLKRVLTGLFKLTECVFGMHISEVRGQDVWHPQVRLFAVYDARQQPRGYFYLDLYARANKRESAWMDSCQQRRKRIDNTLQLPIAFLTCNFTPAATEQVTLLTHDEVLTLFHEFGHSLQHILTQIDSASVSGIQGVAWDAVELPSQLFEYFAWEPKVLALISGHHQTGEPLPNEWIQQMRAMKTFQIGLYLTRQLELALFDFYLHWQFNPAQGYAQISRILTEVRHQTGVVPVPVFNRFQHSFSHIFAGGYAAGYYSYLWAEMLACDIFARFVAGGVIDAELGLLFLHTFLEQGGAVDADILFQRFQGRNPQPMAFLQYWGIT